MTKFSDMVNILSAAEIIRELLEKQEGTRSSESL